MTPAAHRHGMLLIELSGAIAGLALFSAVVVAALSGARQQVAVEATSVHLEEAQNLLARWRAGQPITAVGWATDIHITAPGCEVLVLHGHGIRLTTVRSIPPAAVHPATGITP